MCIMNTAQLADSSAVATRKPTCEQAHSNMAKQRHPPPLLIQLEDEPNTSHLIAESSFVKRRRDSGKEIAEVNGSACLELCILGA